MALECRFYMVVIFVTKPYVDIIFGLV